MPGTLLPARDSAMKMQSVSAFMVTFIGGGCCKVDDKII